MKHLTISNYGTSLGLESFRMVVRSAEGKKHFPLNRLCTVSVAKRGVSISSDLIEAFSHRGIKLFFLDFRGVAHSALLGEAQHGTVAVRHAQMVFSQSEENLVLAKEFVIAKLKNQRAVLNHFNKYHQHTALVEASVTLKQCAVQAKTATDRAQLMGFEGGGASAYFSALREAKLFSSSFERREGRGSQEINNGLMNLGYAILSSYILNAIVNAGLEPYCGVLHTERPGKMALVLDVMEEYRPWVVDRCVIKMRQGIEGKAVITSDIKKQFIQSIHDTCAKRYPLKKKKVKLEHIMQRQIYRLAGHFYGQKTYRPYLFKW